MCAICMPQLCQNRKLDFVIGRNIFQVVDGTYFFSFLFPFPDLASLLIMFYREKYVRKKFYLYACSNATDYDDDVLHCMTNVTHVRGAGKYPRALDLAPPTDPYPLPSSYIYLRMLPPATLFVTARDVSQRTQTEVISAPLQRTLIPPPRASTAR
jgi:hypothetical protein